MSIRYRIRGTSASAIASSVESAISEGHLPHGSKLPTVRDLSARLGVSPATTAAAYKTLQARGLVHSAGRAGTHVATTPPIAVPAEVPLPAGIRDLVSGGPDPRLLPDVATAIARIDTSVRGYGQQQTLDALAGVARRAFDADGLPARDIAVCSGALGTLERILEAHLRPGDAVAVEDPGYAAVLDLVRAMGLRPVPVAVDTDLGMRPDALEAALRSKGAPVAVVLTPRAHNPTGAAFDRRRAGELSAVLAHHPAVLVIEDDHAGGASGAPAFSTINPSRARWAIVRSVSKWLGPDLRLAVVTGDDLTLRRVLGRQRVTNGWVSGLLQQIVAELWRDPKTESSVRRAAEAYRNRREALVAALAERGVRATARSGMNVWVPVAAEQPVVAALRDRGFAVRAGEGFRLASPPGIRVTTSTLDAHDAAEVAAAIAGVLDGGSTRLA